MTQPQRSRWTEKDATEWYARQPWLCGFNYVPANAISYTEMWMPSHFDQGLIDKELALAEEIGFNVLRVVLPFVVWEHNPDEFITRMAEFVRLCESHGLRVMPALFDDCAFGSEERLKDPWYGDQPDVLDGWYANGWTPSPGHSMVRDPSTWLRLERYVRHIVSSFRDTAGVVAWDLYNEPTNGGLGGASLPLVPRVFEWARSCDPEQPLTVGIWNDNDELNSIIVSNTDILTFHDYQPSDALTAKIRKLRQYGRPIINTEWLNRPNGSTVAGCLPVFKAENVGCMHWGLVNGRTQTDLHWGWRPGMGEPNEWQHDLFTPNHVPYDEAELNLFRTTLGSPGVGRG